MSYFPLWQRIQVPPLCITGQSRTHYCCDNPLQITKKGYSTDDELFSLLNVGNTRLFYLTRQMKEMGLIEIEGRGKEKRYILPD